jgi:uncharacterized protein (UPF0335 family)
MSARIGDNNMADDFLARFDTAVALTNEIKGIKVDLKEVFDEAEKAGHNVKAMKRAMKDAEKSGSTREADDADYRQMMAWLKKPVGLSNTGASMPSEPVMTEHEREAMDQAGYTVGRLGGARASNCYSPGTLLFCSWDGGWLRGAEEREATNRATIAPTRSATTNTSAAP